MMEVHATYGFISTFISDTSYEAKFMTIYGKKTKLGKRIKTLKHNMR